MNNVFQEPPPPPYMQSTGKFDEYVPGSTATMYAVPPSQTVQQQQPEGTARYSSNVPTMPLAFGTQVVPMMALGDAPVQCTCAYCRSPIVTRVERTAGLLTWLLCGILAFFGCWLGCCLIPFCIPEIQNAQHYCPNCNAFIGEYRGL